MIETQQATDFYKGFLMSRPSFKPQDFGVDMDRRQFDEIIVEAFNANVRGSTIDELLLHPREALNLCDTVRHNNNGWIDVPDDIILRVVMIHRKNPGG